MTNKMTCKDGYWMSNGEKYSPCDQKDCNFYQEGTLEVICFQCVHSNADPMDFHDNSNIIYCECTNCYQVESINICEPKFEINIVNNNISGIRKYINETV